MWNKYFVFLTGILLFNDIGKYQCSAERVDRQFPLGTIGCLFADNVCVSGETCIDVFLNVVSCISIDHEASNRGNGLKARRRKTQNKAKALEEIIDIDYLLFGTCSDSLLPEDFVYTLSGNDLDKLEGELVKLSPDFTWMDGYTQCILQNVLVSLTIRKPFDKKICFSLLEWDDPVTKDIDSTLADLMAESMYEDETPQLEGFPLMPNSQKRDEIIKVHKYFDKSKSIHKRNNLGPNYLSYYPADTLDYYPENSPNYQRQSNTGYFQDDGLSMNDLELLEELLAEREQQNRGPSKLSTLLSLDQPQEEEMVPVFENAIQRDYGIEDEMKPGFMWENDEDVYNIDGSQTGDVLELPEEPIETTEEEVEDQMLDALPPDLANRLDQLIRGIIQAEDLTDEELELLAPYVSKILERLNEQEFLEDEEEAEAQEDPLESLATNAVETDMMQETEGLPFGVEEEDMNMNPGDEDDYDDDDEFIVQTLDDVPDTDEDDDREIVEKKADGTNNVLDAAAPAVEKKNQKDVVDTNVAFIEMNEPLTEKTAKELINAVQSVVPVNKGSLNTYILQGKELKIDVDPDEAGLNATEVARQADKNKSKLEEATHLKFVRSGLGNQNEVEFKSPGDRYFVLTFILCGCIAGILLAVIAIYLIRRNTRSKEKLQQIATVQEGNEAASKDYQDLCRQRMQSKSSEKPEPLHAASRVGSVSESQVRSPSSRSSTSSWSEEPVNSNMDISTGHIVLSYMEDHLKNKDRLDREWEAMCSYEADPCSTKVAEDQSNARKNRYGDVMPYDHSRVVLTTNTNVSGSDYINASTITDHDPRNPAYVATQGPLPHTVADFWQMVWEQGSVVIVMLTKLKESGEDKSHRYWPEEGSDLYHIYEVHLVSEHIWCEDYIVRSFYLKNLQTSETRTVTQFHFLTWPDLGIPSSIKALLDFRRKVNKSYRGRSCPIVVHCSEGCGRTGTYTLVDMVLNRMAKGAKEIDIAATLEHIRDQRMNMVKTKEQFQFALAAVAEEVHAILKALPQ